MALALAASAPSQSVDIDAVVARLAPEVERSLLEGHIPSASVALVAGGEVLWTGGFGHANVWARTPATPSTVYLIGSTFKAMSTFALLQQMEQGKFELDQPVNKHLTAFQIRGEDPAHPISFRHLLTHTSGLPADFGGVPVWSGQLPPPLEEYLENALRVDRPPAARTEYSNLAYSLVGHLVGRFSGQGYRDYMQEHIFDALQMRDTAFELRPDMVERLAIPYRYNSETGAMQPVDLVRARVWPAGIVYGTIHDQANWLLANLNGGVLNGSRLISPTTFEEVMKVQFAQFSGPMSSGWGNDTTSYGLTWWITPDHDGERTFAHSGSVRGYTAFLAGNLDRKIGFAILTNGDRAHAHLIRLAKLSLELLRANMK